MSRSELLKTSKSEPLPTITVKKDTFWCNYPDSISPNISPKVGKDGKDVLGTSTSTNFNRSSNNPIDRVMSTLAYIKDMQPVTQPKSVASLPKKPSKVATGRGTITSRTEQDNTNGQDIPEVIEGTYSNDFNILAVHDIIMRRFKWLREERLDQLKHLAQVEETKLTSRQNMVDRKNSQAKIIELDKQIQDISSDKDQIDYLNKASVYLQEYKRLGSLSHVVSFETNNKSDVIEVDQTPQEQYIRKMIIADYIEIAKRHIRIELCRELPKGYHCNGCGQEMDEAVVAEQGISFCDDCGAEKIAIVRSPFYKDSVRVSNSRNNYEDRENFMKAMKRYQGKQNNKPPPELYKDLNSYFGNVDIPPAEEIKTMALDSEGRRGKTNKELMYKALSETGNSGYFEDINLICHIYWNWLLPDISHLEDRIMKDYDITQLFYNAIPKERKSSLNCQFRLYRHLKRYQKEIPYPIRARDFKIPTTRDILEWHQNIWAEMERQAFSGPGLKDDKLAELIELGLDQGVGGGSDDFLGSDEY